MKKITIAGIGMSPADITAEAAKAIGEAQVLIGSRRLTEDFGTERHTVFNAFRPEEILSIVESQDAERFVFLVSGDTGFYSAAGKAAEALAAYDTVILPGISSAAYFFARCGLSYEHAALISCHGRSANLADTVRRSRLTFALTGGNVHELADELIRAGYGDLTVHTGQDLGYPEERISVTTAAGLKEHEYSSLTVLIIENDDPDPRVRAGIPDEEFIRTEVPMTKSEIRAMVASKLALRPGDICCDIGCGTGSVTVEMALAAYEGRVYAFDKNESAVELTMQNCAAFHIGNVECFAGTAPEALGSIPAVDAAFIGGSSGSMASIMRILYDKNPAVRMTATAITLESVSDAVDSFKALGIEPEIVQISAARARKAGRYHMMIGQNPVYIISGCASSPEEES